MKDVQYYMNLEYEVKITPDKDYDGSTYFIAEYKGLNGLVGTGDTEHRALSDLEEVKEDWFKTNIELGREISEPTNYALS